MLPISNIYSKSSIELVVVMVVKLIAYIHFLKSIPIFLTAVVVILFSNNVQSKNTKYKLHIHMYTWMIPDDTLLMVARETEAHSAGNRIHAAKTVLLQPLHTGVHYYLWYYLCTKAFTKIRLIQIYEQVKRHNHKVTVRKNIKHGVSSTGRTSRRFGLPV